MRLLEDFCVRFALGAHRRQSSVVSNQATFSEAAYQAWRLEELRRQFADNFDWSILAGKRVFDFGCGTGELSLLCSQMGAQAVLGCDLHPEGINQARMRVPVGTFHIPRSTTAIDLPDGSVDVIACFDVLEHIMDHREIFGEWHRILSGGGRVLIWWSVWRHPYGHHELHVVPVPWVHLLAPMSTLYRACERVYDSPEFRPRKWHLNPDGSRKPNPYRGLTEPDDLNKLTIRQAEREFRDVGFRIAAREIQPFTGSRLAWLKHLLVKLPVPDPFCSAVIYELVKR